MNQLVIVVEEAHHVLYRQEHCSQETVMDMLMRQCREIGIGMVVVGQHPHLISSAALGNKYTTILLNQKDPADINKAAALALLDESDKKWLSKENVRYGSLAHEFWKRFYANEFRKRGYLVELEAPRPKGRPGRVDVLARKRDETVAIEVETGKSNVVENVRQDLLVKFDKVLVVTTDEEAPGKVERELAGAGLVIPQRVRLTLRDQFEKSA